jgi:hypothetical protein
LNRFESLEGFETLWGVVMEATKTPVYKAAIALLIRLHSIDRHAPPLQKSIRGIRTSFVATCVDYLQGVTPTFGLAPAPSSATAPMSPAAATTTVPVQQTAAPSTPSRIPNPNAPTSSPAKATAASVVAAVSSPPPPSTPVLPARIVPPTPERISRCLLVLRCFVKGESELEGVAVRQHVGAAEQLQFSLQLRPALKLKFDVSMVSTQTVGELRSYASTVFQHPSEYLELYRAGEPKPLTIDAMFLQEIRGNKNARYINLQVYKQPLPKDIGISATEGASADTPAGVISCDLKTFQFLYDLMEQPHDFAQEAYDLLTSMPVCPPLVAAIRNFSFSMPQVNITHITIAWSYLFNPVCCMLWMNSYCIPSVHCHYYLTKK